MYLRPLHSAQSQQLAYRFSRYAKPKNICRGRAGRAPHRNYQSSIVWQAVAANHYERICLRQSQNFNQNRYSSFKASAATAVATSLADVEYRVCELERTAQLRRLNNYDVQHEIWPLLAACTSIPTSISSSSSHYKSRISQEQSLLRAKLSNRLLELCLKEVEDRRVFLWEWLQTTTATPNNSNNTDNESDNNFSPTKFWNEAPHPTKEMFNLVLSSWKNVIESCSYNSIKDENAMDIMENAAREASSLLLLMEDEYSSDSAFIQEYNSRIDKGRFISLMVGAALPDVMNYSEVIGAWGQCIDGSALRLPNKRSRNGGGRSNPIRDGSLQRRLRLEASAMKAMMELLESMEEDLYGTFCSETMMHQDVPPQRKKPAPDRVCYNIILASMARQLNPSLYEMRLVLQRMMERVKYELEKQDDSDEYDDHDNAHAMSFFPDVFSYNALIEARANRAAMFTTDTNNNNGSGPQLGMQQKLKRPQSRWRQQLTEVPQVMKSRFTSSEEEAILAEQILEEISHIATVSVLPNIWSYNAVMKAWIKCGTERGLHRSVLMLQSLALSGTNIRGDDENVDKNEASTTLFERISRWGASLLSNDGDSRRTNDNRIKAVTRNKSKISEQHTNAPQFAGVGIASRLNYLEQENRVKKSNQSHTSQFSVGMHSRMALMSSAFQPNDMNAESPSKPENIEEKQRIDTIGPLPHIEPDVLPDINTFRLLINALERRDSITCAKLAEDLLRLLEEYYAELSPSTTIYNSVLNAWSRAGKLENDAKASVYAADRAFALLQHMLDEESQLRRNFLPAPNESSFLLVINAFAHAANAATKAGNISDAENAANTAEELLKRLEEQSLETRQIALSCRGNVVRILASLAGLTTSQSGYAARAQTLLTTMAGEAGQLPIDVIYFNAVLDAWARDLSRKDTDESMNLLSRPHTLLMELIGGKYNTIPDNSSYNHVIRALYAPWTSRQKIGKEEDRRKAWDMVFSVYSIISERHRGSCMPDAHTYLHMFKALACLWPTDKSTSSDERLVLCRDIFHSCCQNGQLTKTAFWVISTFLTPSTLMDLLAHEMGEQDVPKQLQHIPADLLYTHIPAEWSRNGRNCKSLNRHKQ